MNAITIKRYLKKANYKVVPVQSDEVCMIAGPDEALGVFLIVRDLEESVEKAIFQGVNKLCRFRSKLNDLIQETLDDIEISVSLYLFCPCHWTISSQCNMNLSIKGVKLLKLDEQSESLSNYFPRFELEGEEVENYAAYVEYLQTVAKFFNSGLNLSNNMHGVRQNKVTEGITIPIFKLLENMQNHASFEIKSPHITIDNSESRNT